MTVWIKMALGHTEQKTTVNKNLIDSNVERGEGVLSEPLFSVNDLWYPVSVSRTMNDRQNMKKKSIGDSKLK